MVKFFPIVKEEEDPEQRIAVHSIQVFGHKYSSDELLNLEFLDELYKVAELPSPEEGGDNVEGGVVLFRVLGFLATMLRDLHFLYKRRKAASLDPSLITVSTCISGCYVYTNERTCRRMYVHILCKRHVCTCW